MPMSCMETVDRTAEDARRASGDVRESTGRSGGAGAASDPYSLLCEISLGNLEAMLKATDIFARGLRMMNTALIGSTWIAMDDAMADAKTAMSCRSFRQFIELEADTAPISVHRYIGRATVLCRMATQLVQDVLFPLERRVIVALDLFGRKVH